MYQFDIELEEVLIPKFEEKFKLIEDFLKAKAFSPTTEKEYRKRLESFFYWLNKDKEEDILLISFDDILNYKNYLIERKLQNSSISTILTPIKTLFKWLVQLKRIKDNPSIGIELPKIKEAFANNLEDDEVEKILNAVTKFKNVKRNLAIIGLLLNGLRCSEVVSLNVRDYDNKRILIRESKCDSSGHVPLFNWVELAINEYLEERKYTEIYNNVSPLFVLDPNKVFDRCGQRITYRAIVNLIDRLKQETNIDFTAHQFRHTFATELLRKGMNPNDIQTLMRHKHSNSLRRYTKAANYEVAEREFRKFEKE